jgi:hypothetical protein
MMTLEEAIIHCEDVANDRAGCCEDCAEEHRQLAEWLKELRAFRERAPKGDRRVTCATCGHLDIQNVQGQAAPVGICRSKIWDGLHMAPHLIGHDLCLPIPCNHWEPKGEGQNDGTNN